MKNLPSFILIGLLLLVFAGVSADCHTPEICNLRNSAEVSEITPTESSVCAPDNYCGWPMVIYPFYDFADLKGDVSLFWGEVMGVPFYFDLSLEGVRQGTAHFMLCHGGWPAGLTMTYSFHIEDAAGSQSRTLIGSFLTGDQSTCPGGSSNAATNPMDSIKIVIGEKVIELKDTYKRLCPNPLGREK